VSINPPVESLVGNSFRNPVLDIMGFAIGNLACY
jgi:hypothetical protein